MARKKKALQPLSMAFLDVICCGFGAIILLFVLTSGKKSADTVNQLSDTEFDLGRLRKDIQGEEKLLLQLASSIEEIKKRLQELKSLEIDFSTTLTDRTTDLSLLLSQLAEMEELQETLLGDLENLPTVPEEVPIPMPNPTRRQYLTDFKLDGERVLFLIEASGGMLDDTIDGAIERLSGNEEEKRAAPKWKQTMRALEWMLTALKPPTTYQILFFSKNVDTVIPLRAGEWLEISDRQTMGEALGKIKEFVPQGGANLERAFFHVGGMNPRPDNIILFVDGLPTLSDSVPAGPIIDQQARVRMYNAALRQAPLGIPINTIMMPLTGDPAAATSFWLLGTKTNGSFICPSRNWPET